MADRPEVIEWCPVCDRVEREANPGRPPGWSSCLGYRPDLGKDVSHQAEPFVKLRVIVDGEGERLREAQVAIDKAWSALSSSQYVGGPSQREAWQIAAAALGPLATEHTGQE